MNIDIKDEEDIKELTVQSAVFLDPGRWKDFSNECKDLLNKLLEADPKKRLSASGALNHPWVREYSRAKARKGRLPTSRWQQSRAEHAMDAFRVRTECCPAPTVAKPTHLLR